MNLPLNGIMVLDLTRLLPGPYCSHILRNLGADVLKIEEPGIGDYSRISKPMLKGKGPTFTLLNRGKRSMTLNLKSHEGREIFFQLAQKADIVIEGFRPGVVKKLGIDYQTLSQVNPKLIYCSISGYGQNGPYAQYAGHDLNYAGYCGMLDLSGEEEGPPAIPGVQIADIGGGTLISTVEILAALLSRGISGRGKFLDISMIDGVMAFLPVAISQYLATGDSLKRGAGRLTGGFPCYNIYPTQDGKYVTLGALEAKFWHKFCQAVDRSDLIELQFDSTRKEYVSSELRQIFTGKTREEWLQFDREHDVCLGPVNSVAEALLDPHIKLRAKQNGGCVRFPIDIDINDSEVDETVPELGQHTVEVLEELGLDRQFIIDLKQKNVI